jgi:hypothetical protein
MRRLRRFTLDFEFDLYHVEMVEVVEVFSAHKFILQIYQIYLTVNFVIRSGPESSERKTFKIATQYESMAINENGGE